MTFLKPTKDTKDGPTFAGSLAKRRWTIRGNFLTQAITRARPSRN
jgi:hypothetical protein